MSVVQKTTGYRYLLAFLGKLRADGSTKGYKLPATHTIYRYLRRTNADSQLGRTQLNVVACRVSELEAWAGRTFNTARAEPGVAGAISIFGEEPPGTACQKNLWSPALRYEDNRSKLCTIAEDGILRGIVSKKKELVLWEWGSRAGCEG